MNRPLNRHKLEGVVSQLCFLAHPTQLLRLLLGPPKMHLLNHI